jgi:hypothetical protein
MCELAHCHAGAERLESVSPSFYTQFLDTDMSIHLHSSTIYGTTLLRKDNLDYPLTIPKTEAIIFCANGTLLNFFGGGEPGCFHCMLCYLDSESK